MPFQSVTQSPTPSLIPDLAPFPHPCTPLTLTGPFPSTPTVTALCFTPLYFIRQVARGVPVGMRWDGGELPAPVLLEDLWGQQRRPGGLWDHSVYLPHSLRGPCSPTLY